MSMVIAELLLQQAFLNSRSLLDNLLVALRRHVRRQI